MQETNINLSEEVLVEVNEEVGHLLSTPQDVQAVDVVAIGHMSDLSDSSKLPRILATNKDVIYKRDESPIRKVMPGKKRLAVRSWVRIPALAKYFFSRNLH